MITWACCFVTVASHWTLSGQVPAYTECCSIHHPPLRTTRWGVYTHAEYS